ncbi:hypothetical protein D3C71_782270 [compost metagenome]
MPRRRDRMAGTDGKHHLFGIEVLKDKSHHPVSPRQTSHDKIEVAEAQLFQQHRVFTSDDLDAAPSLFLQKKIHGPRHDVAGNRRQRTDPY